MNSILNELKKFSSRVLELNPPVEEKNIDAFEKKYDLLLPEDYKALVKVYNGFSLLGSEVLGIFNDGTPISLNAIYEFEHLHGLYPMPKQFIPFSPDGAGGHYCFDVGELKNGLCTIIFWQRGYEYTLDDAPEITNPSFTDWVQDVVINWTLAEYDYNGDERK